MPADPVPLPLPDHVWDEPSFLTALNDRDVGALFVLMSRYGCSQTLLASRCGMSQGEVSRICTGKRRVTDLEVFVRVADGLAMPDRARSRLLGGGSSPRSTSLLRPVRSHGWTGKPMSVARVDARAYSGDWVGSVDAPPAQDSSERRMLMAADETFQFLVNAERAVPSPEVMDLLHAEVRRLVAAYPTQATNLVDPLISAQRVAFRLLDGPGVPHQSRDLYFLAAITSGLLALAGVDLSQFQAARMNARAAYLCADRADHPGLRVWIRIEQARAAYWSGAPREALRYLSLAHADAETVTGSMPVQLAVQEARAHAALGDVAETRAALARATETREHVQADDLDEIGGELTFPQAVQLFVSADALTLLPDHAEAERAATEAVHAFDTPDAADASYGSKAGAYIDLAMVRIRQGEVEGGRETLGPVLAIPPAQRNHGIRTLIRRVHGSLSDPRHAGSAVARDTAAEIETFSAVPTSTRLPE
ncbi:MULTISPECIES: helix-turn-helix transcriptional regulator [unclassified Frankia]|uniref:helix-turn-helix domain-containing protein n=1 Tax=unclassified Frankia TaxID=2632575 RepID=UPI002AD203BA|nr:MULTISPECIES: helix-turn-helix transcriptional regulator [unclassified Frankia]